VRLIVGLGNPGKLYRDTWHNLGAATVERLAARWGVMFQPGKGDFIYAETFRKRRKVTLLIPTSYMNRSGGPVALWLRYHRVAPEQVLIVFDDHDMPLGRIRIRKVWKISSGWWAAMKSPA
jgi:PTH1 family peptidyl-tRNA hydrolase